jgi:uncharacterized protein (TIGR02246 family)
MTKTDSPYYALVERQAQAWQAQDYAAIVADFAEDAIFQSPGGIWIGKQAIRVAAERFFMQAHNVHIQITRVIGTADQGAAEWTWSETRTSDRRVTTYEDAIIFVLRNQKISYWREYFDTATAQHE